MGNFISTASLPTGPIGWLRLWRRGSGLEGLAPLSSGQLTRCFSAVAELLVGSVKIRGNFEGLLSMTEVENRGEEGISDVSTISVPSHSPKLASQLFSAFCEARIRHAVCAVNDADSSFLNSFNLIGLGYRK